MVVLKLWWMIVCFVASANSLPTVHSIVGNVNETLNISVNNANEYIIYYNSISRNPFRIRVSSENADPTNPVLVVVRQEKEVMSWGLPLMVETSKGDKKYYNVTSRTMCHNHMNQIGALTLSSFMKAFFQQKFTVAISSSCIKDTTVLVETIKEKHFFMTDGKNTSLIVSPSQSRYVFYKFNNYSSDTVTIEVDSNDDVCLVVSIQDSHCPVFDLGKEIKYKGRYQTISRKGALTIKKKDFSEGFFLVFIAQPDNYECKEDHTLFPLKDISYLEQNSDASSNVSFVIHDSLNGKQYLRATLVTMVAIALFYVFAVALCVAFWKYGSIKDIRESRANIPIDEDITDDALPRSSMDIMYVLEKPDLDVKVLTKYPMKDKKRSFNYLWHIISIAIFYSIPVVQLVITYQRMVNSTGNEDLCYYNFLCAHPLFSFNDFNHIFSNIGYIFMGTLFLFATIFRQTVIPFRFEIGIPVHYGIYYAMGVALIIEGLLSACYHICPSQSNYQFDTSFMYIMAVLCIIKLYQNRHPDLNATAYATFSVLGFGIFLATIGILNGTLVVWLIFVFGYSIFCFYLSFKVYFLSYVLKGFEKLRNDITKNGFEKESFVPVKKVRFIILTLANVMNMAMLIVGLMLYFNGSTDFGTFLLGILMANAVLHTLFYTIMKLLHEERICIEAIIYGILGLVSWIIATIFFLDAATLWTVTPAESRQWNQQCVLLDYYDKHDVWHLLSAPALYFTFMYLMCLDDDIIDKRQDQIPVF